MHLNKEHGIYLIDNNNDISIFMYKKLKNDELERALPLSYDSKKGNYFMCIYSNGDYIGQTCWDGIFSFITVMNDNVISVLQKKEHIFEWIKRHDKKPLSSTDINNIIDTFS